MRQQWHRPLKTLRVGTIPNVPERYLIIRIEYIELRTMALAYQSCGLRQEFHQSFREFQVF